MEEMLFSLFKRIGTRNWGTYTHWLRMNYETILKGDINRLLKELVLRCTVRDELSDRIKDTWNTGGLLSLRKWKNQLERYRKEYHLLKGTWKRMESMRNGLRIVLMRWLNRGY
jgi:hypothetical protein